MKPSWWKRLTYNPRPDLPNPLLAGVVLVVVVYAIAFGIIALTS